MHASDVGLICHLQMLLQQVLHVAILVQDQAAVAALLDIGFSSFDRNSRRWTALDEAIATKHLGITKLLYTHAYAYKKQRMKEKKAQLLGTCNELPNYSVKVYASLLLSSSCEVMLQLLVVNPHCIILWHLYQCSGQSCVL